MWSQAARVVVSQEQRAWRESGQGSASTPQSVALRCRIILLGAEGVSNNQISKQLEVSRPTILLWRQRFEDGGPHALTEIAPGRGRPPRTGAGQGRRAV